MWAYYHSKPNYSNKLLKAILIGLITILLPIAMFFAGFGWYDSWEVHLTNNPQLLNQPIFFEHGLVAGSSALTISLLFILFIVLLDLKIQELTYFWQRIFAWVIIAIFTILFCITESVTAVLSSYFLTPWLIIALILFPIIYLEIITIVLINQKSFHYLQQRFNHFHKPIKSAEAV